MKELVKFLQKYFNETRSADLVVDGILGIHTRGELLEFILRNGGQSILDWSIERRIVAAVQYIINSNHLVEPLTIDGYFGPQTQYKFEVYLHYQTTGSAPAFWRDEQDETFATGINPYHFPANTYEEMCEAYGKPGDRAHLTPMRLPYAMKLAWDPAQVVDTTIVNKALAEPFAEVLEEIKEFYGLEAIADYGLDLFGGCYNFRKKRGGSTWSTHAWAAAMDFDPSRNALKMKAPEAQFSKPAYEKWWKIWESYGFVSLGRTKNYDWMHVQATK